MAEHHVISRVMQLLDRFRYYSSTLNSHEMSPPPYAIIIIYYNSNNVKLYNTTIIVHYNV